MLVIVFLAAMARTFAPAQLGGTTTYTATEGISMQPRFHSGDLALVRPASTYRVGDIVLYNSSVVGRPVLHRIVLRQNGNYFLRGDNNDFVDPGYATRSQIVGKLWLRVPRLGGWLSWFGSPGHAPAVAALVTLGLCLTALPVRRRRRRRRHMPLPAPAVAVTKRAAKPPDVNTSADSGVPITTADHPPSFIDGPLPTLLAFGVSLLLAGIFLGVGFALPSQRSTQIADAYRQSGVFSYQATPKRATPVYPSGMVTTGDPIYPSLVNSVRLTYDYRFTSALPHSVHGTIALRALLQSPDDTWQSLSNLRGAVTFKGDEARVSTEITLRKLYALVETVTAQSGSQPGSYAADIEPVVHLAGSVDGKPIKTAFSPTLPLEIDPSAITLKVVVGAPPPGATYIPPTRQEELQSSLSPTISGAIPGIGANAVNIARYQPTVTALRTLGFVFAALTAALFGAHEVWRRRRRRRSDEQRLAKRLGIPLLPVDELPLASGPPIEVRTFAELAELAQYLERPVLYTVGPEVRSYAVDEGIRTYQFHRSHMIHQSSHDDLPDPPDRSGAGVAGPPGRHRSTSRRATLGGGTALLMVVGALVLVTSSTATTVVPVSYVSSSSGEHQVSQLAPAGCSSLNVTSLVVGSGTFSNSLSHALILGGASTENFTDHGANNCIVVGGGTNTISAPSSDICITGPTLSVAGSCSSLANGVTATVASYNFGNYGGQHEVILASTHAITALTITISVAETTGVTFNSLSNSFPANAVTGSHTISGAKIIYAFVLKAGHSIPATYQNGTAYAQFSDTGSPHAASGDTWTVTSTANGVSSTLNGTF